MREPFLVHTSEVMQPGKETLTQSLKPGFPGEMHEPCVPGENLPASPGKNLPASPGVQPEREETVKLTPSTVSEVQNPSQDVEFPMTESGSGAGELDGAENTGIDTEIPE